MLDIQDRFMLFLMEIFYESLKEDLKRQSQLMTKAVEREDEKDIETYFKMMKSTREILKDLSDDNLDIKDFVHLLAHKYGFLMNEVSN